VKSPDLMLEAMEWLYQLETRDDIEGFWPAFDAWFEASEEHRAAYAEARRRWLRLTGVRPKVTRRVRSRARLRPLVGGVAEWAFTDRIEWHLFLIALAALLALTIGATSGVWGIGSSNMNGLIDLLR
jgi:ferric-dicitrate binding protein FerR (iron transport regulator)